MAITLRELIAEVREELLALPESEDPEALLPLLFVDEVEVEVAVTVSTAVHGSGKVTIHVLELGGGGERADEQAHRVRVKMSPLLTKEEIRAQLQQDPDLWARVQYLNLRGATKEESVLGED